jgi:hypothetical protein
MKILFSSTMLNMAATKITMRSELLSNFKNRTIMSQYFIYLMSSAVMCGVEGLTVK